MSDTVLAALIGASASVTVALVGKPRAPGVRTEGDMRPMPRSNERRQLPPRSWVITICALIVWLLVSPGAVHHDFSGTNFLLVPLVFCFLALLRPIRPLTAGWVTLAVFSANFVIGPLGNRLAGSAYDTQFVSAADKVWRILILGFITAAFVAGTCALRLGKRRFDDLEPQPDAPSRLSDIRETITADLERLAALHAAGKLTDEEFRDAKGRVLK